MDILNTKQKIIVIIIAIFMLLFVGYYIINKANDSEYIILETEEETVKNANVNEEVIYEEKEEKIIIHITGAVKKQGIVEVREGARISDVISAAGGTIDKADLSKINLAYAVKDGQKIYIPSINDEVATENITEEAGENIIDDGNTISRNQKVNINTASQTELETLSGVGPSTALKIINYRNENGNFEKIEDIKNVPGIGEAKYENIKDSICVK